MGIPLAIRAKKHKLAAMANSLCRMCVGPPGLGCAGARHRWLRHRQRLLRPSGPTAWKAFASIERTPPRTRRPRAENHSQPLPAPKGTTPVWHGPVPGSQSYSESRYAYSSSLVVSQPWFKHTA